LSRSEDWSSEVDVDDANGDVGEGMISSSSEDSDGVDDEEDSDEELSSSSEDSFSWNDDTSEDELAAWISD
jgi:hypothetical protein